MGSAGSDEHDGIKLARLVKVEKRLIKIRNKHWPGVYFRAKAIMLITMHPATRNVEHPLVDERSVAHVILTSNQGVVHSV